MTTNQQNGDDVWIRVLAIFLVILLIALVVR